MSWLDKILPSRIRAEKESKGSVPEGLWHKCLNCDTVIYRAEFEKNPRTRLMTANLQKIDAEEQLLITQHAQTLLNNLENI